jgi:type IV secretory pathway ATPase VirB11/archaellum biosynthesis ATPase
MDAIRHTLSTVLRTDDVGRACACTTSFDGETLVVDSSDCPEGGELETSPACRETVVGALTERDADLVRVEARGIERCYEADAAALLVAAGRFAETVRHRDQRLASRALRDPLGAAREATGRADAVADIAAETGLAALAERADGYETALAPLVGLSISDWRVEAGPPPAGELLNVRELETGDTVRIYDAGETRRYVLRPLGRTLSEPEAAVLSTAYQRLADGLVDGGDRAPRRAVRQVVDERAGARGKDDDSTLSVPVLGRILARHTQGHGLLETLFADPDLSDVFVTAPAPENTLRVRVGDRTLATNVRLTEHGVDALASRYRRESGRGFSRANPTLDAATNIDGRRVRVAGVTEPASDGVAFAFRAHDREVWTLPALVANDTLTPRAAALLSLAVERGGAMLIAGPRGAGKTTLLGALLPEVPSTVRTVVVEDAPELPVTPLQQEGRDVQALRATTEDGELSATDAVRTALRLGDGALVVGEIRGTEAQSLYEAMRVGANSEAVLGTVHGDGAAAVYDRVVDDLGVPPSSFGVTDLVVTLERTAEGARRVQAIEEVLDGRDGSFAAVFDRQSGDLASTGRIDRGNARLLATLSRPSESYADLRTVLAEGTDRLAHAAEAGRTDLAAVTSASGEHL